MGRVRPWALDAVIRVGGIAAEIFRSLTYGMSARPMPRLRITAVTWMTMLLVGGFGAVAASCASLRVPGDGSEASVRRLDSLWANAYASHDTAFSAALLDPRIMIVSANGNIKSRARELADVAPDSSSRVDYFRSRDVQVHLYDRAAVVVGILEWSLTSGGRTTVIRRRYSAMYAQGGALGWRIVALNIGAALT